MHGNSKNGIRGRLEATKRDNNKNTTAKGESILPLFSGGNPPVLHQ